MKIVKPYSLSLFLLFSSALLHAEIYQWTDANGKVHFGDKAPKDNKAKKIETKSTNIDTSQEENEKLKQVFNNQSDAEKRYQQRNQQDSQQAQQKRQEACNAANRQLNILRGRVYFTDENGNDYEISEAEREQQAKQLAAKISQICE